MPLALLVTPPLTYLIASILNQVHTHKHMQVHDLIWLLTAVNKLESICSLTVTDYIYMYFIMCMSECVCVRVCVCET